MAERSSVRLRLLVPHVALTACSPRHFLPCSHEGLTALDLAKQKRDIVAAQAPPAGAEEGAGMEEKRKMDKIIEWLEKGLPQQ